jgi:hypothetical protein
MFAGRAEANPLWTDGFCGCGSPKKQKRDTATDELDSSSVSLAWPAKV